VDIAVSSTLQNLQFLEAQLDQYLHSHEDDGTTLWVTPQGMRMPYKKTKDNLEQNMKYVEVQLEKYLHEHETDTDTILDQEIEVVSASLWNNDDDGTITVSGEGSGRTDAIYAQGFIANNGVSIGAIDVRLSIQGTPQGSVYLELYEGSTPSTVGALLATSDSIAESSLPEQPSGTTIVTNGENTENGWPMIQFTFATPHVSTGNQMYFMIKRTVTSGTHLVHAHVFFNGSYPYADGTVWFFREDTSAWQQDSFNNIAFRLYAGGGATSTLYTRPTGFRFPYGWTNDGHLRHNMKFLELEISQYLHKHEAGT
jgi:hypothetical protein